MGLIYVVMRIKNNIGIPPKSRSPYILSYTLLPEKNCPGIFPYLSRDVLISLINSSVFLCMNVPYFF
jgi:hypothetical protein